MRKTPAKLAQGHDLAGRCLPDDIRHVSQGGRVPVASPAEITQELAHIAPQ